MADNPLHTMEWIAPFVNQQILLVAFVFLIEFVAMDCMNQCNCNETPGMDDDVPEHVPQLCSNCSRISSSGSLKQTAAVQFDEVSKNHFWLS